MTFLAQDTERCITFIGEMNTNCMTSFAFIGLKHRTRFGLMIRMAHSAERMRAITGLMFTSNIASGASILIHRITPNGMMMNIAHHTPIARRKTAGVPQMSIFLTILALPAIIIGMALALAMGACRSLTILSRMTSPSTLRTEEL